MSELRFDNQTVVITGGGRGLGRAYAIFFASRGANVVVNEQPRLHGGAPEALESLIDHITAMGGVAVASFDSVENGEKIIETATRTFGRVDVLINHASIRRGTTFKDMTNHDWDLVTTVNIKGAYKCTKAAWPHFRNQGYGRIINTASAAGSLGSFGEANYSAANLSQVGFTETLAKEGRKYNIICNAIAPSARDVVHFNRDWAVALVAVLAHSTNTQETGSIFELIAGHMSKLRWERAKGALFKPDSSFTPGAVLKRWDAVNDFSSPEYPTGPVDFAKALERASRIISNSSGANISFRGRVALVTGAGAGLGRSYALLFARLGASVLVNDLVDPEPVVREIQKTGFGKAVGFKASVEDGDSVVQKAIDAFGRIDIVVNNAGIIRDKAFGNMDDRHWGDVVKVHLHGAYMVARAAWPHFIEQNYGRVINTTSPSGIYGNFGQANYAAAKLGILGFSSALAREGAKHNILVNTISPIAGTNMARTIMPEEMVQALRPDYVAPLVALLCSDDAPSRSTGRLYEVGCGWIGRTRWQRSGGHKFAADVKPTPEAVLDVWHDILNFDIWQASHPEDGWDTTKKASHSIGALL